MIKFYRFSSEEHTASQRCLSQLPLIGAVHFLAVGFEGEGIFLFVHLS